MASEVLGINAGNAVVSGMNEDWLWLEKSGETSITTNAVNAYAKLSAMANIPIKRVECLLHETRHEACRFYRLFFPLPD